MMLLGRSFSIPNSQFIKHVGGEFESKLGECSVNKSYVIPISAALSSLPI